MQSRLGRAILGVVIASLGLAVPNAPQAAAAPADSPVGAGIYVGDGSGGIRVFDRFATPIGGFGTGFAGAEMAVGDVTGDGIDDVAMAAGSSVRIFTRTGTPAGGFATGLSGVAAAAAGDFNGNRVDEIMVVDGAGAVRIGAGSGQSGGFNSGVADVLTAAAGDFTGAGDTDEVMVMETDGSVRLFTGSGAPAGSFETHPDVEHAAAGDVNGDGNDDVIIEVRDGFTRRVAMFSGAGSPLGGFDLGAIPGIEALSSGDADANGSSDILIASGDGFTGAVRILDRSGTSLGSINSGPGIPEALAGGVQLDVDVDGIPDSAERFGLLNPDGSMNLDLPGLGANPCQKTIAVEIDYMADATHSHIPELWAGGSVDRMRAAFANASIPAIASCPYPGSSPAQGIALVTDVDDAIPEQTVLPMPDGFQDIKSAHFEAVRDSYVHYNVWGHRYDNGDGTDSSGLSNFADPQDFLLTLDAFGGGNGTTLQQAGTFMHELGHSLGLDHGGNDEVNHKPNYLSVMNYRFQTALTRTEPSGAVVDFVDFSREALNNLDAKHLFEAQHLGLSEPLHSIWFDLTGARHNERADGNINWSGDDFDLNGVFDDDQNVAVAINQGRCVGPGSDGVLTTSASTQDMTVGTRILSGSDLICNTAAGAGDKQESPVGTEHRFFNGFNDWANINLRRGFGPGAPLDPDPPVELTAQEAFEEQQADDQAAAPDRTVLLAAPKPGFHQTVLGVAADDLNVYATHFYQSQADPHVSFGKGSLVVLDRVTLAVKARIPVGFGPRAVAVNPVTHKVYVLNGFAPGVPNEMTVSVIDRDALAVVNTVTLASGQPAVDIAVNSNLNRVYVSNSAAGRLQVIDGATNQELAPILIGPRPVGIAVDETTNTVHAALNNRVTEPFVTALGSAIDHGSSHTVLPPVTLGPTGTQPVDVAVDGQNKRIYTANLGGGGIQPSASVLDATTRSVIAQLPLVRPGRAVTVNPFTHQAFVAGEENVYVIGEQSLTVQRRIPATLPFAIATPAGTFPHLYTGDLRNGILTRLAYTSGTSVP